MNKARPGLLIYKSINRYSLHWRLQRIAKCIRWIECIRCWFRGAGFCSLCIQVTSNRLHHGHDHDSWKFKQPFKILCHPMLVGSEKSQESDQTPRKRTTVQAYDFNWTPVCTFQLEQLHLHVPIGIAIPVIYAPCLGEPDNIATLCQCIEVWWCWSSTVSVTGLRVCGSNLQRPTQTCRKRDSWCTALFPYDQQDQQNKPVSWFIPDCLCRLVSTAHAGEVVGHPSSTSKLVLVLRLQKMNQMQSG